MISRRRVLTILGGVAALPVLPIPGVLASTSSPGQWRGIALGAPAHIVLDHPDADHLISLAVAEMRRLEKIFSLYRKDSDLSKLNRSGHLSDPALDLVELLAICSRINTQTSGAFDPTVQALWSLYAREMSDGRAPDDDQIAQAQERTGWRHVDFSAGSVRFDRSEVALTLNGIAQGFIADKVTALFRRQGVSNVLVNTGEIAALGTGHDDLPWQVKLGDETGETIKLSDAAVATSAPLGTAFDAAGLVGHIIDPRTGRPGGNWRQVSVVSASAAVADGLSTAFCLMTRPEIEAAKGDSQVYLKTI